ncbi:hypothetical protein D3C87_1607330 [compost metagenome]
MQGVVPRRDCTDDAYRDVVEGGVTQRDVRQAFHCQISRCAPGQNRHLHLYPPRQLERHANLRGDALGKLLDLFFQLIGDTAHIVCAGADGQCRP